jgi:hypothetical protein
MRLRDQEMSTRDSWFQIVTALRFAIGQSITGCERKIWVRLKADTVRVVLSKEVSRPELFRPERVT